MGLATLYNAPADIESLMTWSFSHAGHHTQIIQFTLTQKNTILTPYILDPLNPDDMLLWEYQHQIMHNQMNSVLGIAGQNLVGIDWKDPEALSDFIDVNASEHLQANTILGIP